MSSYFVGMVRLSIVVLLMCVVSADLQAAPLGEGDTCGAKSSNWYRSCTSGTHCSDPLGTGTCIKNRLDEGDTCGAKSSNWYRSCTSGTHCSSPSGTGTCVAKSGSNQYCLSNSQCKEGLVCEISQTRCRHDPPLAGEACNNIYAQCKDGEGLYCGTPPEDPFDTRPRCLSAGSEGDRCGALIYPPCNEDAGLFCASIFEPSGGLTCKKKRTIGESCWDSSGCRDGLRCLLCELGKCDHAQACFPVEGHEIWPPEVCESLHSPAIHKQVIKDDYDDVTTASFGGGSSLTLGVVTASDELGNVYGEDGSYGCYLTTCVGFEPGLGVADFATFGEYWDFASVAGVSEVVNLSIGASSGIVGGSIGFGVISNLNGDVIGIAESLTLGIGVSPPLSGSVVQCHTTLDMIAALEDLDDPSSLVMIENTPPVAACADGLSVCVDNQCEALVDIDDGSYDPDRESLARSQSPPGPFTLGTHRIDLTVTDPDGDSDSCFAYVDVEDCTAPRVTCPAPLQAECTSPLGAEISFSASAEDNCSGMLTADCSPSSGSWLALGANTLDCHAVDHTGNRGQCQSPVVVVDTTPPGLSCNSPGQVLASDFPLTIRATAEDICDDSLSQPLVSNARCIKPKSNGKEIDVSSGCGLSIDGDQLSIHNGTGVGTQIHWEIAVEDASGNSASTQCMLEIMHPAGKK